MPHRTIKLAPELCDFVGARVESGRYENANELIQAAFRALHREERKSEQERPARSIAEGDVFRKLWETSAESSLIRR
jgi:putative addiction module CopG family antidote